MLLVSLWYVIFKRFAYLCYESVDNYGFHVANRYNDHIADDSVHNEYSNDIADNSYLAGNERSHGINGGDNEYNNGNNRAGDDDDRRAASYLQ